MAQKYYAVRKGRNPGVYDNWYDAKVQVDGFPGAVHRSFLTREEAEEYVGFRPTAHETHGTGNMPETAYTFVDGSFNPKTKVYGYGGFLVLSANSDGSREELVLQGSGSDPSLRSMRNVAGEIAGARAAIEAAVTHGVQELVLFYDYLGIENWPTRRWKANLDGTRSYAELVRQAMRDGLRIEFRHVKGHSGIPGNERADQLAKEAVGLAGHD